MRKTDDCRGLVRTGFESSDHSRGREHAGWRKISRKDGRDVELLYKRPESLGSRAGWVRGHGLHAHIRVPLYLLFFLVCSRFW